MVISPRSLPIRWKCSYCPSTISGWAEGGWRHCYRTVCSMLRISRFTCCASSYPWCSRGKSWPSVEVTLSALQLLMKLCYKVFCPEFWCVRIARLYEHTFMCACAGALFVWLPFWTGQGLCTKSKDESKSPLDSVKVNACKGKGYCVGLTLAPAGCSWMLFSRGETLQTICRVKHVRNNIHAIYSASVCGWLMVYVPVPERDEYHTYMYAL